MVLQPNFFFSLLSAQNELNVKISKFFIICSCYIKVRQLQLAVQHINFFFRRRHLNMDVLLKNSLFPKIDFQRDIIRAKIWFLYGKRSLSSAEAPAGYPIKISIIEKIESARGTMGGGKRREHKTQVRDERTAIKMSKNPRWRTTVKNSKQRKNI